MKVRTHRSDYDAGYAARVEGSPIPASVSRAWAKGYHAAWLANAAGGAA